MVQIKGEIGEAPFLAALRNPFKFDPGRRHF